MAADEERGGGRRPPRNGDAQRRQSNGRVPPHNIPAEEALLGAALLSTSAFEIVATEIEPSAFYKPTHIAIAAAMGRLFAAGAPCDPVTVYDELVREGAVDVPLVDLLGLEARTPATSNVGRYASIVTDHATLRAMQVIGTEIIELADGLPTDVGAAVLRANALMDQALSNGTGRHLSTLDVADVGAILDGTFELVEPDFLTRSDGQALLYAGKMHVFQAEPTSGKSWLALAASLEVLSMGGAVVYLDYEDTPRGLIGRLLSLGADPAIVRERFRYVRPEGPMGPAEKVELEKLLAELNPDLAIIDGVAEAMVRDGLDEDRAPDNVAWVENYPRWLARKGIAVVQLDHVAKDREKRGRTARGSGHKLAAVDGAAYEIMVATAFSRHKKGKLLLRLAKDRLGAVGATGDVVGVVTIEPHADGERVLLSIDAHVPRAAKGEPWKPTRLMARASHELAEAKVPLTADALTTICAGGSTKPALIREAIARLMAEGYVTEAATKPRTLRLLKPYFEDEEPGPTDEEAAQQDLALGIDPDRPPGDPGF